MDIRRRAVGKVLSLKTCYPVFLLFYAMVLPYSAGAEIDLVIEKNSKERYAIEIKRSQAPSVSKGFTWLRRYWATKRFIVYPQGTLSGDERDHAIPVLDMMNELRMEDKPISSPNIQQIFKEYQSTHKDKFELIASYVYTLLLHIKRFITIHQDRRRSYLSYS